MKIKRAFLIYPPTGLYMRDDRCQAPTEGMTAQPHRAPMDLAYMAASLENAGVECRIKDYPSEKDDWENLANDINVFSPDMLIISIITPTIKEDLKACKVAKDICGDILNKLKRRAGKRSYEDSIYYRRVPVTIRDIYPEPDHQSYRSGFKHFLPIFGARSNQKLRKYRFNHNSSGCPILQEVDGWLLPGVITVNGNR